MKTKQQKLSINTFIAIAVGWVILFLLTGCDGKAKKQAVKPSPPDVQVTEVTQGKVPIVMEFSGTIKAIKIVDIIPRVSGYIDKRQFEEGTFVKKDDPLYLIDPRPYQARLDADKAQLKLDQATLAFWKKETKRYQSLVKQGAASREKTEATIAKRDETLATVAKDKANIENAQLNLDFTNITAPFDGRIQETRINVGNLVQQQRDVLTTLVQMDPVYVVFNVSRSHLFEIQLLKRQGKLYEIADMRIEIQLPDGSTYSQPALVESQIGKQVFVVTQDNKVESRSVDVGRGYQGQWVIKKGLKKGEKVIVEGTQKVRPGMVVDAKPYPPKKEKKIQDKS